MVYSRRRRLPMQEQDPIYLTHNQSSTPELGTSNPFNPSLLNQGFDTVLNIPVAIHMGVRSCTKHPFYPTIDFATNIRPLPLIYPGIQFLILYKRL